MVRRIQVPIENNREFAAELGIFLSQWAVVEMNLIWLLQIALQKKSSAQAQIIFMSSNSVSSKLELIERLLYAAFEANDNLSKVTDLLGQAKTLNGERNKYVHATWVSAGGANPDSFTALSGRIANNVKDIHRVPGVVSVGSLKASVAQLSELNGKFEDLKALPDAGLQLLA